MDYGRVTRDACDLSFLKMQIVRNYKIAGRGNVAPLNMTPLAYAVFYMFSCFDRLLVHTGYVRNSIGYFVGNTKDKAVIALFFVMAFCAGDLFVG